MEEFIVQWTNDNKGWKKLKNYYHLDLEIEKELKQTVKKDKYTLYRGIYLDEKYGQEFLYSINTNIPQKHKYANVRINELTSWSLDINEAEEFADVIDYPGLVLKTEILAKDVLADLSTINQWEKEIILKPGKYNIEIVEIVNPRYLFKYLS